MDNSQMGSGQASKEKANTFAIASAVIAGVGLVFSFIFSLMPEILINHLRFFDYTAYKWFGYLWFPYYLIVGAVTLVLGIIAYKKSEDHRLSLTLSVVGMTMGGYWLIEFLFMIFRSILRAILGAF